MNYQARFAALVEGGLKRQTVRAWRKRPIKVGDTLYHYCGLRTKGARRLLVSTCRHEQAIVIIPRTGNLLWMPWARPLPPKEAFAHLDGFESWEAMLDWVRKAHGEGEFHGQLIQW